MISVVIPLYNKAHTIVNTLTTVMNQTYIDFEVVIVNDGSIDNSVEIINEHFQDSRIKIINQENAGVSAARNRGVKEAKGDWIAFLDADDEWLPKYLETFIDVLQKYPTANMIGCASYYKDFQTGKVSANALIDKYKDKAVEINYFMNPDKMTHIGATIIRKKKFIEAGGFDPELKNNEDLLLQGSIAMKGNFIYIGQCLHVYVGNVEGQATSDISKQDKYTKDKIEVLNKLYQLYLKQGKKNKLVPISIKYRGRHFILGLLKRQQYHMLKLAYAGFSASLQKMFRIPIYLCDHQAYSICVIYIYVTKLLWRMHGFPRVGVISKYNTESVQKYYIAHEQ